MGSLKVYVRGHQLRATVTSSHTGRALQAGFQIPGNTANPYARLRYTTGLPGIDTSGLPKTRVQLGRDLWMGTTPTATIVVLVVRLGINLGSIPVCGGTGPISSRRLH